MCFLTRAKIFHLFWSCPLLSVPPGDSICSMQDMSLSTGSLFYSPEVKRQRGHYPATSLFLPSPSPSPYLHVFVRVPGGQVSDQPSKKFFLHVLLATWWHCNIISHFRVIQNVHILPFYCFNKETTNMVQDESPPWTPETGLRWSVDKALWLASLLSGAWSPRTHIRVERTDPQNCALPAQGHHTSIWHTHNNNKENELIRLKFLNSTDN